MRQAAVKKDFLDEVVEHLAQTRPGFREGWEEKTRAFELAKLRQQARMTQKDVAEKIGRPQPRVSEIESKPESVSVARLSEYLSAIGYELRIEKKQVRRKGEKGSRGQ